MPNGDGKMGPQGAPERALQPLLGAPFGRCSGSLLRSFGVYLEAILGLVWEHSEVILGVFCKSRGAPRPDLASGRSQDASRAALGRLQGASGAALGRLWGASGVPLGRLLAASRTPSGPKLAPWGRQVGSNMGSGRLPTWIPGRHLFREGVRTPKWSQNAPHMEPKWGQLEATLHVRLKELENLKTIIFLVYFQYS